MVLTVIIKFYDVVNAFAVDVRYAAIKRKVPRMKPSKTYALSMLMKHVCKNGGGRLSHDVVISRKRTFFWQNKLFWKLSGQSADSSGSRSFFPLSTKKFE